MSIQTDTRTATTPTTTGDTATAPAVRNGLARLAFSHHRALAVMAVASPPQRSSRPSRPPACS